MIFCDKKEGAEPSLFFVCNAKRRQSDVGSSDKSKKESRPKTFF